ncbi:hypothetical protein [Tumebacillus permanentifrigoris]|uniref:Uncharacterized protein n=1 Tax=Tumebacillus permanentifrigoris TaxID=378543 RepID=A0A316D541_9BACL|nr:hypothetical protein [Tumebacillus permanentifrigoris]PWK05255.1 hypothetical protein C7459_1244 [Tumebacillus permanentifrigoris]
MSTKEKIFKNFGPDVLCAVADWQQRGYAVSHPQSRLIITAEKTELVVESWPGTTVCELRQPVAIRREVSALLFGEYESGASVKTVTAINDLLAEAERHHRKLPEEIRKTFSREWRALIDLLEGAGYATRWISIPDAPLIAGTIRFDKEHTCITAGCYRGAWRIGIVGDYPTLLYRHLSTDHDSEAIAAIRKWMAEVSGQKEGVA